MPVTYVPVANEEGLAADALVAARAANGWMVALTGPAAELARAVPARLATADAMPIVMLYWFALGMMSPDEAAMDVLLATHMVCAVPLGAALDAVFSEEVITATTMSTMRAAVLRAATHLRITTPAPFMLAPGGLMGLDLRGLAVQGAPQVAPAWVCHWRLREFVGTNGTLAPLAELEMVMQPRSILSERVGRAATPAVPAIQGQAAAPAVPAVLSGFGRLVGIIYTLISTESRAIIGTFSLQEQAMEFAATAMGVLPTPVELTYYPTTRLAASNALSAAVTAAQSGVPDAISMANVETALPHFELLLSVVDTCDGARAMLSQLAETLRTINGSPLSTLGTLGTAEQRVEPYADTLRAMRGRGDSHLLRLSYLRESLEEAVIDAKRANPKGGDAAVASFAQSAESSLGYPEMHRSELRRLLNTKEYGIKQAELEKMLDGMAAGDAHEARLAQAASGDAESVDDEFSFGLDALGTPDSDETRVHPDVIISYIFRSRLSLWLHGLLGFKRAVPGAPIVARIAEELSIYGAQFVGNLLAEILLPPMGDGDRPVPPPQPTIWAALCKGSFEVDWENLFAAISAFLAGKPSAMRIPEGTQYCHMGRLQASRRTLVPFLTQLGWLPGTSRSLDTLMNLLETYKANCSSGDQAAIEDVLRRVMLTALREASAAFRSQLIALNPTKKISVFFVIPASGAVADITAEMRRVPGRNALAAQLPQLLPPTEVARLNLAAQWVPEGLGGASSRTAKTTPVALQQQREDKEEAKEAKEAKAGKDKVRVGQYARHLVAQEGGKTYIGRPGHQKGAEDAKVVASRGWEKGWCLPFMLNESANPHGFCCSKGEPGHGMSGGDDSKCHPVSQKAKAWRTANLRSLMVLTLAAAAPAGGDAARAAPRWASAMRYATRAVTETQPAQMTGGGVPTAPLRAPSSGTAPTPRAGEPRATWSSPVGCLAAAGNAWEADCGREGERHTPSPRDEQPDELPLLPEKKGEDDDPPALAFLTPDAPQADAPSGTTPPAIDADDFARRGGHAFLPVYRAPSRLRAPSYVLLPGGPGKMMFGRDHTADAVAGGERRSGSGYEAQRWARGLHADRADLAAFLFYVDAEAAGGAGGMVTGYFAYDPPPPWLGRAVTTSAELAARPASEAVWVDVDALADDPRGRLARLQVARARCFAEPAPDFTETGAVLGALGTTPVAPGMDRHPRTGACPALTAAEVMQKAERGIAQLRELMAKELASGDDGGLAGWIEYLAGWHDQLRPPEWAQLQAAVLAQAARALDPVILTVPWPAYARQVCSARLPPLCAPPTPFPAIPGGASSWADALGTQCHSEACDWMRRTERAINAFVGGAAAEEVWAMLPKAKAWGTEHFSSWAAALIDAGEVLTLEDGRFALLDRSQQVDTHFNTAVWAEVLEENESPDLALRDALCTHGVPYLAAMKPLLYLSPPLRSFFQDRAGFFNVHEELTSMAKRGWFKIYPMPDLAKDVLSIPSCPWRLNQSGLTPRPNGGPWRGICNYGCPNQDLYTTPLTWGTALERWADDAPLTLAGGGGDAPAAVTAPAAALQLGGVRSGGIADPRPLLKKRAVPRTTRVRSLNESTGTDASRLLRSEHRRAMHGAGDHARQRFSSALKKRPELPGMHDSFVAGLVEPSHIQSWEGGRWSWPAELKTLFLEVMLAVCIACAYAELIGEEVFIITDDESKGFHQFATIVCARWCCGMIRMDPASLSRATLEPHLDSVLAAVEERCMAMGVSPSSNWAQRALTELCVALERRASAEAEGRMRAKEAEFPAFGRMREERRRMSRVTGRNEARHVWCGSYTDDLCMIVVAAFNVVPLLRVYYALFGPSGVNIEMAPPTKRSIGVDAHFIGGHILAPGMLAYVTDEKAHRTQMELREALSDNMLLSKYISLVGLLNHLVGLLCVPYTWMYGVYDNLDAARDAKLGQDQCVTMTAKGGKAISRWLQEVIRVVGVSALAAVYPECGRPSRGMLVHAMTSDAALRGTGSPALCGCLYRYFYIILLTEAMKTLPIVALEFLCVSINVVVFAQYLGDAPCAMVVDALVVPTILSGKASSRLMRYMHEQLVELPEYQQLAPNMVTRQLYGPMNEVVDAGSRGRVLEMESILRHLGHEPEHVKLPQRVYNIIDDVVAEWARLTPAERCAEHAALSRPLTAAEQRRAEQETPRAPPQRPDADTHTSVSLGPHNPSMDGSPRAQDSEDDEPVLLDAVAVGSPRSSCAEGEQLSPLAEPCAESPLATVAAASELARAHLDAEASLREAAPLGLRESGEHWAGRISAWLAAGAAAADGETPAEEEGTTASAHEADGPGEVEVEVELELTEEEESADDAAVPSIAGARRSLPLGTLSTDPQAAQLRALAAAGSIGGGLWADGTTDDPIAPDATASEMRTSAPSSSGLPRPIAARGAAPHASQMHMHSEARLAKGAGGKHAAGMPLAPPKLPRAKPRKACGVCANCARENCGQCKYCVDMPRFGGTGKARKPCTLRTCLALIIAAQPTPVESRASPWAARASMQLAVAQPLAAATLGLAPLAAAAHLDLHAPAGAGVWGWLVSSVYGGDCARSQCERRCNCHRRAPLGDVPSAGAGAQRESWPQRESTRRVWEKEDRDRRKRQALGACLSATTLADGCEFCPQAPGETADGEATEPELTAAGAQLLALAGVPPEAAPHAATHHSWHAALSGAGSSAAHAALGETAEPVAPCAEEEFEGDDLVALQNEYAAQEAVVEHWEQLGAFAGPTLGDQPGLPEPAASASPPQAWYHAGRRSRQTGGLPGAAGWFCGVTPAGGGEVSPPARERWEWSMRAALPSGAPPPSPPPSPPPARVRATLWNVPTARASTASRATGTERATSPQHNGSWAQTPAAVPSLPRMTTLPHMRHAGPRREAMGMGRPEPAPARMSRAVGVRANPASHSLTRLMRPRLAPAGGLHGRSAAFWAGQARPNRQPSALPPLQLPTAESQSRRAMRQAANLSVLSLQPELRQEQTEAVYGLFSDAYADTTRKRDAGHFKAWTEACEWLGTSPWRTDVQANLGLDASGHQEEIYVAVSACLRMYSRMLPRSRRDPAPHPNSVAKKYGAVVREHKLRMIPMLSSSYINLAVKGLLRRYVREHGVTSLAPKRKLPLTNALIDAVLATPDGTGSGRHQVRWSSYRGRAMRACLCTLAETGMRKDEVAKESGGGTFEAGRLTRASLTFKIRGEMIADPTEAQLNSMGPGDGVLLQHGRAKNDPWGAWFTSTPSFLAWRQRGRCACRALVALELAGRVPATQRSLCPLFGPAPNIEFEHADLETGLSLMLTAGDGRHGGGLSAAAASDYSVHSFRIHLACALLAAECPRFMIKRLLRWRGDDSLEAYARVNDSTWALWTDRARHAEVDSSITARLPHLDVNPEVEATFARVALRFLGDDTAAARAASADM